VATTRGFQVYEGGGEYNVARGLRRCFGLETAIVTAPVDNQIGRLLQDLIYQGGVDQSFVRWVPFDKVGRRARNGLNFTERGYGLRGSVGCSDRGHTAVSQLRPGEIDWDEILGRHGARWLHCGGIFAALSETTASVALEAFEAARRHGTVVSYDLNYRESLWQEIGGPARAAEVNRELLRHVDVVVGNEEDFRAALGFRVAGVDEQFTRLEPERYGEMLEAVEREYPNLALLAATLRTVRSATRNDWSAVCRYEGRLNQATPRTARRDLRPDRRRRLVRVRALLRVPRRARGAGGRRVRGRPRRAGDDDSRRHVDGERCRTSSTSSAAAARGYCANGAAAGKSLQ